MLPFTWFQAGRDSVGRWEYKEKAQQLKATNDRNAVAARHIGLSMTR